MGVTGAGKTTIGTALAAELGWRFVEGDQLHPPANVVKMQAGIPLSDADRAPWLAAVHAIVARVDRPPRASRGRLFGTQRALPGGAPR